MKKLKTIFAACLAAVCLASCISETNDNSNDTLTPAQVGQCLTATLGNYSGNILYQTAPITASIIDNSDTLDIEWSVQRDTTVMVSQFPAEVAASNISDKALAEALLQAGPAPLKAYMGFYKATPVSFLLAPVSVEYDIDYNGGSHTATLVFWVNTYSYGLYDATTRLFEMQLVAGGLFIDDDTSKNYFTGGSSATAQIPVVITTQQFNK